MAKETVAVYWDFENIHASLYDSANGSGMHTHQSLFKFEDIVTKTSGITNIPNCI